MLRPLRKALAALEGHGPTHEGNRLYSSIPASRERDSAGAAAVPIVVTVVTAVPTAGADARRGRRNL